jgi:hypothetical protein
VVCEDELEKVRPVAAGHYSRSLLERTSFYGNHHHRSIDTLPVTSDNQFKIVSYKKHPISLSKQTQLLHLIKC